MYGWRVFVIVALIFTARSARAASSCALPSGYVCPSQCLSCNQDWLSCDYSTSCTGFGDVACSAGDATVDTRYCFPFGSAHTCRRSGWVSNNTCFECQANHYGPNCFSCNCGSHGSCSDGIYGDGTCSCDYGYNGSRCQYSNAITCNGHGFANYDGSCSCYTGYAGSSCNQCASNYYGYPTCSYCSASTTCSGHGYCTSAGSCSCNSGFGGAHCNDCGIDYYAYPTCRYCTAAVTCSGHGNCDVNGQCQCEPGRTGPNCTSCSSSASCGAYACSNGSCLTSCSSSADCSAGNYCNAGQCRPKLTNGVGCSAGEQCGSGYCVDGVCCNSACGEQCATCAAPGAVGTCSARIGAPTGGRPACAGDGSSCNARCDGVTRTQCVFPPALTSCRSSSCSAGVATEAAHCDGAGTCEPIAQHACGLYTCGTSDCLSACTSVDDCAPTAFCAAGACEIDAEPPTVTFTLPAITNQPIGLSAEVADNGRIATIEVLVNGAPASFGLVGSVVSRSALPLREGANTVLVRATDRAGNVGALQLAITRDTIAPALTFVTPTASQAVGVATIDATVSVSDATTTDVTIGNSTVTVAAGGGLASGTFDLAGAGLHTITATARDAAGNVRTVAIPILVDLNAPIVDVDVASGAMYGLLVDNLLPITVHVDDVASTTVVIGAQSYALARGGGVIHAAIPLAEGTNTFAVRVSSETDKQSVLERVVLYDTTPPVAALTIPPDHAFIAGTVELSVEATDATSDLAFVEFQVDDEPFELARHEAGEPWVLAFDTTQAVDGQHVVTAIAVDRVGNATTMHATVTVDNTPPSIDLLQPLAGSFVRSTISVEASAADQQGLASITLTANSVPIANCPAASSCIVSYDTATNPDGSLLFMAMATDLAGNNAAPRSVEVVSDNNIPSNFITSPAPGTVVTATLFVAVNVVDMYFASVECFVDGVSLGRSTDPTFAQHVDILGKLDGPISVACTANDLAGNTSTQTVSATIKNWTIAFEPQMLNLKSNGDTVVVTVEGANVAQLLPVAQHALALVVPGGSPVPYTEAGPTAPGDADHDGVPDLTLRFDRAALQASIRAGIAGHSIDPASVPLHLFSGTRDLGGTTIRVKE